MEQESQKREIVGQTPNGPILCANNCGFFGSASTNNFCSKCYKDFFLKQSKPSEKKTDETLMSQEEGEGKEAGVVLPIVSEEEGASSVKQPTNRCNFCNKRVGLTGFKCRCGDTFCFVHRYSDKHNCTFDYKGAAQDAIAKANPIVKADKVDKI